jgi:hypothetical protein
MVNSRSFLYNAIFMGIVRPARQWTILVVLRVDATPIGSLHALCGHHVIPTLDKIGTFIIKTDPLELRDPCGVVWVSPFFHILPTVGAGYLLF